MSGIHEIVTTPFGDVKIVSVEAKGTYIKRGDTFTSTSGGYWTNRIIECKGFDEHGRIFGVVVESFEPEEPIGYNKPKNHIDDKYLGLDDVGHKYEQCLCGGDVFHHLILVPWN